MAVNNILKKSILELQFGGTWVKTYNFQQKYFTRF